MKPFFGRSWRVELKYNLEGAMTIAPFVFSMRFQKEVDPLSGMTVNLVTVDKWWSFLNSLNHEDLETPFDYLESVWEILAPHWEKEKIENWELVLTDENAISFIINEKDELIRMPASFVEPIGDLQRNRKVFLTVRSGSQHLDQVLEVLDSNPVSSWQKELKKFPDLVRVEILDVFGSSPELELDL
jgi:hypothetical protein